MEASHDLQCAEVVWKVELVCGIGCVDNVIEGESVWLVPVLLRCVDEVLSTKSESILLLVWRVGDSVDLSTECVGPQECVMSKTATVLWLVNAK